MSMKLIAKSTLDGLTLAAAIIAGVCLWAGSAQADPVAAALCTDKGDPDKSTTPPTPRDYCRNLANDGSVSCGNHDNQKCGGAGQAETCLCNVFGPLTNQACECRDKTVANGE